MNGLISLTLPQAFTASPLSLHYYSMDVEKIEVKPHPVWCPDIPYDVQQSVHSRQAEFIAGRYCAGQALRDLGITGCVKHNLQGKPLWPEGITGSISHTDKRVVACAAHRDEVTNVGVDVEHVIKKDMIAAFKQLIFTSYECSFFEFRQPTPLMLATLIFSAKEAFYKSLPARLQHKFGFQDVSIVEINNGTFKLLIENSTDISLPKNLIINGIYSEENNYIVTLIKN